MKSQVWRASRCQEEVAMLVATRSLVVFGVLIAQVISLPESVAASTDRGSEAALSLGSLEAALSEDAGRSDAKATGAFESWTAGEPSARTRALIESARSSTGLIDEEGSGGAGLGAELDGEKISPLKTVELPEQFDWRDVDGVSYLSPVGPHQGECGSCVAFALSATIEAQLTIACQVSQDPFDLSAQYLFSCGGGDCRQGWRLSEAVQFVAEDGLPDGACFPYQAAAGEDVSCNDACIDVEDRMVSGVSFSRPTTGYINVDAIKQALLSGPLLTNMILFEDLQFYRSGVYRHVTGRQLGGHAVVLVGYDDAKGAWIVRNSWGDAWGEAGYFYVAYDDASLVGRYTWLFDVTRAQDKGACVNRR